LPRAGPGRISNSKRRARPGFSLAARGTKTSTPACLARSIGCLAMKILIVVAHPNPESFNHAIARTAADAARAAGHTVVLHDLYAEGFDPLMPAGEFPKDAPLPPAIEGHCEDLRAADGLVIVHPNWWGQPPAILTGWIDRVVRPGVAYEFKTGAGGEGEPVGLLKLRAALVFNTANTPPDQEIALFGDPLESIWMKCVFGLCQVPNAERRTFSVVIVSTPEQRAGWLEEVRAAVQKRFPS
jgi:putative NADPH-quinone reductase